MYITCCKDCKERHLHCHSSCEKYKTEKAELDKLKESKRGDIEFKHYKQDKNAEWKTALAKRKQNHSKYRHRHHS